MITCGNGKIHADPNRHKQSRFHYKMSARTNCITWSMTKEKTYRNV